MTEGITWEIATTAAHDSQMHKHLEQGWEPFAVTVDVYSGQRTTVWFRRSYKATSP